MPIEDSPLGEELKGNASNKPPEHWATREKGISKQRIEAKYAKYSCCTSVIQVSSYRDR